ncbi:hypothetical protein PHMEG_0006785 [Phytophthora megakarya]|uniref:Uncharacterized protein n=1 Tax=Phytophthora megakarya TaxID=4795 RepID=A0A225WN22_9STRA|nr:hypothetical protein PHMEG_0006785 [Phytophthora megakarya]
MWEVDAVSLQVAVMPPGAAPATGTSAQVSVATSRHSRRTSDVKRSEGGFQAYVNRIFKRVAEPSGSITDLTSHSIRRGGALYVNGDDYLAAQWIFHRDTTKTKKAFTYITNTARKGRKVARVSSGWGTD